MNNDGLGSSTNKRKRMNVEPDRLSSLPDDLIHKILFFIDIKSVVQTSVLSSRWRFVWTSTPYLDFSSEVSSTLLQFSNFVKHVLSGRNNEIEVSSVKLRFRGKVSQVFVKRILNYAFSHNVQEMTITCTEKKIEFPLSLFNSQSLKHLTLRGTSDYGCNSLYYGCNSLTATSTVELPYLTTLHLDHVTLYDDSSDSYMAKCINLKTLTLSHYQMKGSSGFCICHPRLSNLTLKFGKGVVKVIAPQLKTLSVYIPDYSFPCFSDGLPSLEKVDLCIHCPNDAPKIIDLLQQFCGVKYLTVNLEIVEFLSSSVDLISNQPSPFANLKSLKIYPVGENFLGSVRKKVNVSAEVKSYLLDSSPSATFTMVSHEEIRAVKNAILALECIPKVQVLLDELKTDLDLGKTPMESHNAKIHDKGKAKVENQRAQPLMERPLHSEGIMKQIQSCWEDASLWMSYEKGKVSRIFSELKYIEKLLTDIPASKKVKMLAWFASMCEEADTVMNKILERMKIQCDMKQSHLSIYFHRLAKTLQSSS